MRAHRGVSSRAVSAFECIDDCVMLGEELSISMGWSSVSAEKITNVLIAIREIIEE